MARRLHSMYDHLMKMKTPQWNCYYNNISLRLLGTVKSNENSTIIEIQDGVGLITLNRPKFLNALHDSISIPAVEAIQEWEKDPNIQLVIIKSSTEKAFSVGGDLKDVSNCKGDKDKTLNGKRTVSRAYRLIHFIHTSKLPIISLIDGFTIGSGASLAIFGRYRIATERTRYFLPETSIGFYTDAGAAYYLPRLKGNLGMYLGLTGHKLKGKDVYFAGIATHYIPSQDIQDLQQTLLKQENLTIDRINEILDAYHAKYEGGQFSLAPYTEQINKCFGGKSVEEIFKLLEEDGSIWALKCLNISRKLCPTSLKISHRLILEGEKSQYLADIMQTEHRISQSLMEGGDFYEGIRATLIDCDNNPKWNPSTIEQVTDEMVDKHFRRPCDFDMDLARTG